MFLVAQIATTAGDLEFRDIVEGSSSIGLWHGARVAPRRALCAATWVPEALLPRPPPLLAAGPPEGHNSDVDCDRRVPMIAARPMTSQTKPTQGD